MPGRTKTNDHTQLIAGILTIALAVALMVGTVVCMRQCTAQMPTMATTQEQTNPQTITTTVSTMPTLAVNPYGPGDFAYDNGYLTCLSGPSWLGVDVSEYQGEIDWQQVADAGVEFAIIRLGFRAWGSQGELHMDVKAEENLRGALDAGLRVGVYFFSQAISEEEAIEEAQFVLQWLDGAQLEMPVVFDWEFVSSTDARTANMTRAKLNACALAFCREIAAEGYTPVVYFNLDMAKRMYDLQSIQDAGYGFWLAMYSNSMTYAHKLSMWQYTCEGTVPGIRTSVDLNLYFPYE